MLRAIFTIGLMAFLGLFLLKVFFGLFGGFIALMIWLSVVALKILLVGAIAYVVIRIVSPATAKRIRDRLTGTPTTY
jgi:hypothetical protein